MIARRSALSVRMLRFLPVVLVLMAASRLPAQDPAATAFDATVEELQVRDGVDAFVYHSTIRVAACDQHGTVELPRPKWQTSRHAKGAAQPHWRMTAANCVMPR